MSKALSSIPIFEDSRNKKHDEWVELIDDLGAREMESGLVQLIGLLLTRMHARLGGNLDQLTEYVVNNAAAWAFPEVAGERCPRARGRALKDWERHLATLDTAFSAFRRGRCARRPDRGRARHDPSIFALAPTATASKTDHARASEVGASHAKPPHLG